MIQSTRYRVSFPRHSAVLILVSQDSALPNIISDLLDPMRWLIALPLACIVPSFHFLIGTLRFGLDGTLQRSTEGFISTFAGYDFGAKSNIH